MEYDFAKQRLSQLGRHSEIVAIDHKLTSKIKDYCQEGYIVIIDNIKDTTFNNIEKQYHSQIFSKEEVAYCPLDHIKVPLHRKATQKEIENLKSKYELPRILSYDIVCRWMGFKPGDVIAIERRDDKTYFRVVF